MLNSYLLVERSALPDYFIKIVEARRLLDTGVYSQVSDAVRAVGISRSTYYKYKDKIMEPTQFGLGHRASLMLSLSNEAGMLSRVLSVVSDFSANILNINQSLPVHGKVSIVLALDLADSSEPIENLLDTLSGIQGVEKVQLLAVE